MLVQLHGTCQGILGELGILGLRGFLGLGKNWGTDMWNADGQDAGPLPRTPPAVASLPRPAVGHLGFAKGTVLSEPRITRIAQADCADGMGWVS